MFYSFSIRDLKLFVQNLRGKFMPSYSDIGYSTSKKSNEAFLTCVITFGVIAIVSSNGFIYTAWAFGRSKLDEVKRKQEVIAVLSRTAQWQRRITTAIFSAKILDRYILPSLLFSL